MPHIVTLGLHRIFFSKLCNAQKRFRAISKAQSGWRVKQRDPAMKDLFANLLQAKDPVTQGKLKQEDLIAEAGILIVAGSDTQATVLTSTIFYLLHNPVTLCRLQAEIWAAFADVEEIRLGERLSSCHFLRACLQEAMRRTPPVSALLPREILAGGLFVDGRYFPKGIDIGVPHYALHHNELYYPDPFLFDPDRWIVKSRPGYPEEGDAAVARAHSAFCAFSVGRAACVGKTLAYQEMSLILARTIWLFEIRLRGRVGEGSATLGKSRERADEFQTWEGFASSHKGPMVEFKKRLEKLA